jgi:hypothetical protein
MTLTASANHTLDALLELVCVELQLTETQDAQSRGHYQAVADWLSRDGSPLQRFRPHIFPQGSQRLGTTTKPTGRSEFDLDAVCKLTAPREWSPGSLYQLIWDRLSENGIYRPKMKRMPRCIRLEYAGDFHLDIAPAIPDHECGGNSILVPDLNADLALHHPANNNWKSTNPQDYATWFEDQCVPVLIFNEKYARAQVDPVPEKEAIHAKPALKRSVQLFKRWRDVEYADRQKLAPPSIILTTLSGQCYEGQQLCTDSLQSILNSTVAVIDSGQRLRLKNPAHPDENICEKWDGNPTSYRDFCNSVTAFQERWERLQSIRGIPAIEEELTELFGESPVRSAIKRLAERNVIRPRVDRKLQVQLPTGVLVPGISAVPSVRVPANQFHGDCS